MDAHDDNDPNSLMGRLDGVEILLYAIVRLLPRQQQKAMRDILVRLVNQTDAIPGKSDRIEGRLATFKFVQSLLQLEDKKKEDE